MSEPIVNPMAQAVKPPAMNADTLITSAMLTEMRACSGARQWFASTFPNGATLRTAWDACHRDDWRVWFACHVLPHEHIVRLTWRFAGQAFRYAAVWKPSLERYADNVTPENWREASNAATAYTDADAFAYSAAASAAYANAADAAYAAAAYAADADAAYTAAAYAADAAYAAAGDARTEQVLWCAAELFQEESA